MLATAARLRADALRHLFLGELKILDQDVVSVRFLDRAQFIALDILDDGDFHHPFVGEILNDGGNPGKTGLVAPPSNGVLRQQFRSPRAGDRTTMGCRTPFSVIESASSCSLALSMRILG